MKEVEKLEEDKDAAMAALIKEVPDELTVSFSVLRNVLVLYINFYNFSFLKAGDKKIQESIDQLLKGYAAILSSSKSNEDGEKHPF